MAGAGFEDLSQTPGETQILEPGNAESDAVGGIAIDDDRLRRIVELWPTLSEATRELLYHFIDR